ncbi:MAG: hypothetical protein M3O30_16980 [Planctomycetota bacterium]|nr:hypothetical protein [Planctomycetota bacterium]
MQPIKLEYHTPDSASPDRWPLLRVFLMGPFTGALIGLVQTLAVVLCWVDHGEPYYYFQEWSWVYIRFFAIALAGAIVGVPYGFTLCNFEQTHHRRLYLPFAIPLVVTFAFAVAVLIVTIEFQIGRPFGFILLPQFIAIVVSWLISVTIAKRESR